MSNVNESLDRLHQVDGCIGVCLVDAESGMMLGATGGGKDFDLEIAAATNAQVVRAKREAIKALGLNDAIEDILISLGGQYHLIRPLERAGSLFVYLALNRKKANLALARHTLAGVEKELVVD